MQAVHFALAAFAIWLVPFIASFPFFDRNGKLTINIIVFKAVMAVVLSVTAYIASRWFFGKYTPDGYGIAVATLAGFAVVSIIIDQFTIMKMSQISIATYLVQVASMYSLIIIVGLIAAKGRIG